MTLPVVPEDLDGVSFVNPDFYNVLLNSTFQSVSTERSDLVRHAEVTFQNTGQVGGDCDVDPGEPCPDSRPEQGMLYPRG